MFRKFKMCYMPAVEYMCGDGGCIGTGNVFGGMYIAYLTSY